MLFRECGMDTEPGLQRHCLLFYASTKPPTPQPGELYIVSKQPVGLDRTLPSPTTRTDKVTKKFRTNSQQKYCLIGIVLQ